eukprot:g212.t1
MSLSKTLSNIFSRRRVHPQGDLKSSRKKLFSDEGSGKEFTQTGDSDFTDDTFPSTAYGDQVYHVPPSPSGSKFFRPLTSSLTSSQNSTGNLQLGDGVSGKLCGLYNFGNTCYVNAVIQALYSLPRFREELIALTKTWKRETGTKVSFPMAIQKSSSSLQKVDDSVMTGLCDLFIQMNGVNPRAPGKVAPKAFLKTLAKSNPLFNFNNQHDAHEYLHFLINNMIDCIQQKAKLQWRQANEKTKKKLLKYGESKTSSDTSGTNQSTSRAALGGAAVVDTTSVFSPLRPSTWFATQSRRQMGRSSSGGGRNSDQPSFDEREFPKFLETTFICDLLKGMLVNQTKCIQCDSISEKRELFFDLSLEMIRNHPSSSSSNDHRGSNRRRDHSQHSSYRQYNMKRYGYSEETDSEPGISGMDTDYSDSDLDHRYDGDEEGYRQGTHPHQGSSSSGNNINSNNNNNNIRNTTHHPPSILDLLSNFSSNETLRDDAKYSCEVCQSSHEAIRRAVIREYPEYLICHLKRFNYVESLHRHEKSMQRLSIPVQLSLSGRTRINQKKKKKKRKKMDSKEKDKNQNKKDKKEEQEEEDKSQVAVGNHENNKNGNDTGKTSRNGDKDVTKSGPEDDDSNDDSQKENSDSVSGEEDGHRRNAKVVDERVGDAINDKISLMKDDKGVNKPTNGGTNMKKNSSGMFSSTSLPHIPKIPSMKLSKTKSVSTSTSLSNNSSINSSVKSEEENNDDDDDGDNLLSYRLSSIVIHIGNTPFEGHYVTIVNRGLGTNNDWFLFDDETVYSVTPNFVQTQLGVDFGHQQTNLGDSTSSKDGPCSETISGDNNSPSGRSIIPLGIRAIGTSGKRGKSKRKKKDMVSKRHQANRHKLEVYSKRMRSFQPYMIFYALED